MSTAKSWINFDASPTLRFERLPLVGWAYTKNKQRFPKDVRYGDIVRGLPIPAQSCSGLYASHVLEHLALDDCRIALRQSFTLLKPGGIFRMIVPDLEALIKQYVQMTTAEASSEFMRRTSLGRAVAPRGLVDFAKAFLGHAEHLWMWDYKGMARELELAGFVAIRRCTFGDSQDPMFRDVEAPERFVDAVAIECARAAQGDAAGRPADRAI